MERSLVDELLHQEPTLGSDEAEQMAALHGLPPDGWHTRHYATLVLAARRMAQDVQRKDAEHPLVLKFLRERDAAARA
jgi:hypothetical protein